MADYKSGNKILSEEEHEDEVLDFVASILFIIGAGSTLYFLNQFVPEDWEKQWRFLIIFPCSIGAGFILSMFKSLAFTASMWLFSIAVWALVMAFFWWII